MHLFNADISYECIVFITSFIQSENKHFCFVRFIDRVIDVVDIIERIITECSKIDGWGNSGLYLVHNGLITLFIAIYVKI